MNRETIKMTLLKVSMINGHAQAIELLRELADDIEAELKTFETVKQPEYKLTGQDEVIDLLNKL